MEKLALNAVLPIWVIFVYNIEKNDQPTAVRQRNANWIGVRACQGINNPAHEVKMAG